MQAVVLLSNLVSPVAISFHPTALGVVYIGGLTGTISVAVLGTPSPLVTPIAAVAVYSGSYTWHGLTSVHCSADGAWL